MQEQALRKVLLIQAIEETDRAGDALPLTERVEATRAALDSSPPAPETAAGVPLSGATELFLRKRADVLLDSLRARSPGVDRVLAVAGGATSFDRGMLVFSAVLGVMLSFLDGGHGIHIFAPPLLALVAWNVLVYVLMSARRKAQSTTVFGRVYARSARRRLDDFLAHSTHFNAPLAPGLRRFVADWWTIAQPLFALRARRLLHLSAAALASGLVVGYYARALGLRSSAGWEGGHLVGPGTAHALLLALYGPASLLSGVAIPDTGEVASLRWSASAPYESAIGWAHLIAWTAVLYIVLPRLVIALLSTLRLWRLSRQLPPPSGVAGYARITAFPPDARG